MNFVDIKKEFEEHFTKDATEITCCPRRLLTGDPDKLWKWFEEKLKEL